jgi:hypothetical protein
MSERPRKKVRVNSVAVGVEVLETRLDVAVAQGIGPDQLAAAEGVRRLLRRAQDAAYGIDPSPGPISRWWSGALVEAGYQNLHAARAQMIDVYDDADIEAEIPAAVARSQQTLHRDDPRRALIDALRVQAIARQRAFLRRAIEDAYDSLDRQHERLRSFRNIILLLALCIAVLVGITIIGVSSKPSIMPLCFAADGSSADGIRLNCPTGTNVPSPSSGDIMVVALLGLLGGALAAAMSIRNLRGTSTPYDVPVGLALLKVPLGAFTAILGLVAIQGDFVPGLSALDSQQQILAYALVLGYAQQVFTYSLDRRAQTLLNDLPAKDASTPPAGGIAFATAPVATPAARTPDPLAVPSQFVPAAGASTSNGANGASADASRPAPTIDLEPAEPEYEAPPPDDESVIQDDGSTTQPNVPIGDHR